MAKKSQPNYVNAGISYINDDAPVKVLTGIEMVSSMETGMNPATDNEKSKKQINKALY